MNLQPDNFFREKLEGFQKPAPAGTWDRIESKMGKKNNVAGVSWKIAASFLLLATLTYWFLPGTDTSTEQPLAQSTSGPSVPEAQTNKPTAQEVPLSYSNVVDSVTDNEVSESEKKAILKNKIAKIKIKRTLAHEQITLNPYEKKEDLNIVIEEKSDVPPLANAGDPMGEKKNITLKFSAEETNKYLNKNTLAQATSVEQKPSTFKKLLKKANDLKSNQNPFGDLREKKNEILALDFKNEKRGQNK